MILVRGIRLVGFPILIAPIVSDRVWRLGREFVFHDLGENPSPSPYRSDSLSNTRSPSRSASSYASGSSSPRLTFTATWNASSISRSMSCVERFAGRRSRPSARNGGRFSMLACHSCTANDSERASCVQPFLSSFNRMSAPRSVALNRSVQPSLLRQVIRYPTTWSGESKDPFATPLHRRGSMLKPRGGRVG